MAVANATITVRIGGQGVATWQGVADLPFPTIGPFQNAVVRHSSRAELGYDYGRNLRGLGAHLRDERLYVYFTFSQGLEVETGMDTLFGEGSSLPAPKYGRRPMHSPTGFYRARDLGSELGRIIPALPPSPAERRDAPLRRRPARAPRRRAPARTGGRRSTRGETP